MADEEIISFDENIARDLMRMRQEWRSGALTRANRRRRTPIMDGGTTSGGGLFTFTISEYAEDVDCDAGVAVATVTAVPPGMSAPGVGDEILVKDIVGCNLVGSEYLLLGKSGWATDMGLTCDDPDPYEDRDCYAIVNLCPSDWSCGG